MRSLSQGLTSLSLPSAMSAIPASLPFHGHPLLDTILPHGMPPTHTSLPKSNRPNCLQTDRTTTPPPPPLKPLTASRRSWRRVALRSLAALPLVLRASSWSAMVFSRTCTHDEDESGRA